MKREVLVFGVLSIMGVSASGQQSMPDLAYHFKALVMTSEGIQSSTQTNNR